MLSVLGKKWFCSVNYCKVGKCHVKSQVFGPFPKFLLKHKRLTRRLSKHDEFVSIFVYMQLLIESLK